jgi:hypothetical protein
MEFIQNQQFCEAKHQIKDRYLEVKVKYAGLILARYFLTLNKHNRFLTLK